MTKKAPFPWPSAKPGEKTYWRSLDQLSNTKEFREFLEREFPAGASELTNPMSRRSFMHLMGASLALAGLAGCRRPAEKILPYTRQPENLVLGVPKYYATAMALGCETFGLLAKSNEGRPTKLEGNPEHPSSLGATNVFAQAAILDLYDLDRSQKALIHQKPVGSDEILGQLRIHQEAVAKKAGEGFYILSGTITSPTLLALRERMMGSTLSKAQWHTWEPIHDDNSRAGSRIAFGADLHGQLQLDQAKVLAAFDSDFLGLEPDAVRNARSFARNRALSSQAMNRLYVVESAWTITGTSADHRLRVAPSQIPALLVRLAVELKQRGLEIDIPVTWPFPEESLETAGYIPDASQKYISALAQDLIQHRNQGSVLLVGRNQPKEVHALSHLLNQALGAAGTAISFFPKPDSNKTLDRDSIKSLVTDLDQGKVETLVILGGNPVYDAPVDLAFGEKLKKAKLVIHLSISQNETSDVAHIHIPQTHFLETWADSSATDGTVSLMQPLIAPLYEAWSDLELMSFWQTSGKTSSYEILKAHWEPKLGGTIANQPSPTIDSKPTLPLSTQNFQSSWNRALKSGFIKNIEVTSIVPTLQKDAVSSALAQIKPSQKKNIEINFPADYSVYDGRFANNGWLQELPDPITKLVWDNAALVSPKTAEMLGVSNDDLIKIEVQGRSLEVAVHKVPGHADNTITVALGYGRQSVGRVGQGAGFNAYLLRNSATLVSGFDVATQVTALGRKYDDPRDKNWIDLVHISGLTSTQEHFSMEGRDIIRETTLSEFEHHPRGQHKGSPSLQLQALWGKPKEFSEGQQWGMAIDLSKCIGCGACTIACQAENNIPLVGKAQVRKGREMHWIRVDRYFSGSEARPDENPEAVHQPVACVHCENAPCENVCPVAATVHSPDGLNEMVYNRCVGTRYCSNNCPYKVRRFNFLDWRGDVAEVEKLKYNPDVTLRSRGVMEKCTYCVQRIRGAQQEAKHHDKTTVEDGKITPACAQACPADAIVFGDIRDPQSRVSQLKKNPRSYDLLADLNTKPRTSYLSRIRNPNPLLESRKSEAGHE